MINSSIVSLNTAHTNMILVPTTPTIMLTHLMLIPLSQTPLPSSVLNTPLLVCDGSCHGSFNLNFDFVKLLDLFSLCGELLGVQHDDVDIKFINP